MPAALRAKIYLMFASGKIFAKHYFAQHIINNNLAGVTRFKVEVAITRVREHVEIFISFFVNGYAGC